MNTIRANYLDLSDFLGLSFQIKGDKIEGKSKITQDWGLCRNDVVQKVFDSRYDAETGICFLMLAEAGDMGLCIDFEGLSGYADIAVVDRSLLKNRGKNVFSKGQPFALAGIPKEAIKARFAGKIKTKMEPVV